MKTSEIKSSMNKYCQLLNTKNMANEKISYVVVTEENKIWIRRNVQDSHGTLIAKVFTDKRKRWLIKIDNVTSLEIKAVEKLAKDLSEYVETPLNKR